MWKGKVQVEVGTNQKSILGEWMKSEEALCFSLTVLVVLLQKYSFRLLDEVSITVQIVGATSGQRKVLRYPSDSERTFYSLFQQINKDMQAAFGKVLEKSLDIEWVTDADQIGLRYRIRLSPPQTGNLYSPVFSSDPHSFFHSLFRRAVKHYKILAESAAAMPNIPIIDLDYYADEEIKEIDLMAYGPVDEVISSPEFLDRIFENTVEAHSNRVAISYEKKTVTYLQLRKKVNQLATALAKQGVNRGDFVGILLHRSVENYAAMLAIMKCGAAYVPIDPECPSERVKYILEDSTAQYLISDSGFANSYALYNGDVLNTDIELTPALYGWGYDGLDHSTEIERFPTDAAYIIYTSGTTGQPKGVVVSHAAASNLIKAEKAIFQVKPVDRVAQGFSTAFDASIEEIWLAFASGASLYPVDKEVMWSGEDFSRFISKEKITVLSTVPTLLSFMPPASTLRLLILGGEMCPPDLINRWRNKKLRIVNTYGPTEATVISTFADCDASRITIGKPIYNSAIFLTDSSLKQVPIGVPGEICIAGVGLANGYQNNSELTDEKFVVPSFELKSGFAKRIYRSGDLARVNDDGNIEFLGRIDNQVKLRGYRIELAEIETQILQSPNVKQAVVAVKKDPLNNDLLVAYIVPANKSHAFNATELREHLRKRLVPYMIPQVFVELDKLPLLASGKVDRNKLDAVSLNGRVKEASHEALDDIEQRIFEVWKKYFPQKEVLKEDNFFLDLGGHSLFAARTVSELRQQPEFKKLSILDVYNNPSIEKLAKQFALSGRVDDPIHTSPDRTENKANTIRHFFTGVMQFFSFYFVFAFNLLRDLPLYGIFFYLYYNTGHSVTYATSWAIIGSIMSYPLAIVFAVCAKWIVLGQIEAGRYRLWGAFYVRWWFVRKLFQILDLHHLAGTPLLPALYRTLGMKIGEDVHLETSHFAAFDLISIGSGTTIDEGATVNGFTVDNEWLTIGRVVIGSNCFVGARSVVGENATIEDGARLEDLSLVLPGTKVPAGETWSGSPARCTSKINYTEVINPPTFSKFHRLEVSLLYCLLFSAIPIVTSIAFIPGIFLLMQFDPVTEFWSYIASLPMVGASFVLFVAMEVAALKWLLVGRVKPGIYAVHGGFYIRNWIVDQLLRIGLDHIGQLTATTYAPIWYRLLGMKIGKGVELSTAVATTPDLIHLEDGSTIADEVSLGSPHIEKGWMTLAPVHMGYRSFAGNSAVIPTGTRIGEHSLLGVLSIAPKREDAIKANTTWFGSPPILFPKREGSTVPEHRTYHPPRRLRTKRAAFELFRVTLPPAAFIMVMSTTITIGLMMLDKMGAMKTILVLPIVFGLCSVVMVSIVALVKWMVIGKYKPFKRPLWTNFVWKLEFVNALYEFFAAPLLLNLLQGTPFLGWYLRLMGAKIGNECYIDSTGFLEWDLVRLGDRVAINENVVMQTHLFEDRVLKASHLIVGSDCTIGSTSVVLYDSEMRDGSHLEDLSLLMKGEMLPERTKWVGIPAVKAAASSVRQASKKQKIDWQPYQHESATG